MFHPHVNGYSGFFPHAWEETTGMTMNISPASRFGTSMVSLSCTTECDACTTLFVRALRIIANIAGSRKTAENTHDECHHPAAATVGGGYEQVAGRKEHFYYDVPL